MRIAALPPLLLLLLAAPAWAGSVTVVNNGGETIRRIEITPTGASGENRLRSVLPNGATAQIGYGGGCQAIVRLGYESGRTEEFGVVDPCNGARVVSGSGVAAAPIPTNAPTTSGTTTVSARAAPAKPVSPVAVAPVKAPPPEVPAWTGRSITKRFGGLD